MIVLPPGVIRREVDKRSPESWRQAILDPTFILANRNQLLGSGPTDRAAHRLHPVREAVLCEEKEVVNFECVVAGIRAPWSEFNVLGKRGLSADRARGNIPGRGQRRSI